MMDRSAVSGHDRLKEKICVGFLKFLFFCRNVKKFPNFGALRIARKSSGVLLAANTRVLRRFCKSLIIRLLGRGSDFQAFFPKFPNSN